ncbi:cysteine desulfurase NifS [Candidatus Poribacteria bacterium]|nr:cysteine desulfurase NifS [Candidatus Poribacteria bacterium]
MERIYMDHNATTPVHPEVLATILPYYNEKFGNASSVHTFGREARADMEEAREKIADFIGAQPREIIFTSGGTESDNMAILGAVSKNVKKGKHIITSSIEHHAVLNTCKYLENKGHEVTYLNVDKYGVINLDQLRDSIKDDTVLITIMHANNENGTIEPIEEIVKIAAEKGVLVHSDAVQTLGKVPINLKELGVDLMTFSAHKIYGPKGIGILYIRRGTRIDPLIRGGHHERNLRGGTENVPAIVGFAKALEVANSDMDEEQSRLWKLTEKLKNGLLDQIDDLFINSHPENRVPGTMNISFDYLEGESIILSLDMKGVGVSTGSACTSGTLEPSHVLSALGLPIAAAQGAIRFSLGRSNTEEHVDYILQELPPIIKRLRDMSPLYADKMKNKSC